MDGLIPFHFFFLWPWTSSSSSSSTQAQAQVTPHGTRKAARSVIPNRGDEARGAYRRARHKPAGADPALNETIDPDQGRSGRPDEMAIWNRRPGEDSTWDAQCAQKLPLLPPQPARV